MFRELPIVNSIQKKKKKYTHFVLASGIRAKLLPKPKKMKSNILFYSSTDSQGSTIIPVTEKTDGFTGLNQTEEKQLKGTVLVLRFSFSRRVVTLVLLLVWISVAQRWNFFLSISNSYRNQNTEEANQKHTTNANTKKKTKKTAATLHSDSDSDWSKCDKP